MPIGVFEALELCACAELDWQTTEGSVSGRPKPSLLIVAQDKVHTNIVHTNSTPPALLCMFATHRSIFQPDLNEFSIPFCRLPCVARQLHRQLVSSPVDTIGIKLLLTPLAHDQHTRFSLKRAGCSTATFFTPNRPNVLPFTPMFPFTKCLWRFNNAARMHIFTCSNHISSTRIISLPLPRLLHLVCLFTRWARK